MTLPLHHQLEARMEQDGGSGLTRSIGEKLGKHTIINALEI